MSNAAPVRLGATPLPDGSCRFLVWAPRASRVEVAFPERTRGVALEPAGGGYHAGTVPGVPPGTLYAFRLDGGPQRPDPASRLQPQGVHGPSSVVDSAYPWTDQAWFGRPLRELVFYELHVGAFSAEGTFEGVIPRLDTLRELGVTAVELMPVAQFPGERNWGYDGVSLFAAQASYGGPRGLMALADACHARGLALVLDVVYNHLGPEGNYLGEFAPYFTDRYLTPWGDALNFDGAESDEVRRFFMENALTWIEDFHVDALRLDAVHAIRDHSAHPFLQELAEAVAERALALNRRVHLIAESSLNDTRLLRPREQGGFGLDGQWNDDFHHAAHTLLTAERDGYYVDFGRVGHLVKAWREGYVYSGERSAFRQRRHGHSSRAIPAERFVVSIQNHDQVGNRMLGERLGTQLGHEGRKLAAGLMLLSPHLPLLFMGEEYGEKAPFPYFVSHSDPGLVEAVRAGRREEFESFSWKGEPPDPQAEETFASARLDHTLRERGEHRALYLLYKELLRLRREDSVLAQLDKDALEAGGSEAGRFLWLRRWRGEAERLAVFRLRAEGKAAQPALELPPGSWSKRLDSADARWDGPGSALPERLEGGGVVSFPLAPESFALFARED